MKKIKNYLTLVHNLRNGEHFSFYNNTIDFMNEAKPNIPEALPLWKSFCRAFEKENLAYNKNPKSVETKYLKKTDHLRNDVYMMILRRVESTSYSYIDKEKEAAGIIMEVLDNYKNVTTASMITVSSLIVGIVDGLRQPRYKQASNIVGITSMVDKLEQVNNKFKAIYMERAQSREDNKKYGSMEKARLLVNKAFRQFADTVNALYLVNRFAGTDDESNRYAKVIDGLNALIDQAGRDYAHRGWTKKAEA
ncbi:MAG: DUF6261 family protein [Tannerellaceae bacterium]|jgi:hypothetical protein|nr:DUF6261 family protein [Tannerellaceae bacterium]